MRTNLSFLFLTCFLFSTSAFAAETVTLDRALLPHVTAPMQTPEYWIMQHDSPDNVVMTPEGISRFNEGLRINALTDDLVVFPGVYPAAKLKADISRYVNQLKREALFSVDGAAADAAFYDRFEKDMGIAGLGADVPVRYALTTAFVNERLLPTDEPLYAQPRDVDFDELQNSGLDPATPVVVLHQTIDGEWVFVKDGITSGWVRAGQLAFVPQKDWKSIASAGDPAVITAAQTDIYMDDMLDQPMATARMGSRFILKRLTLKYVEVLFPVRGVDGLVQFVSAYIRPADVSRGFLPYTARNVMTQAFKLLDSPYGWGDSRGNPDCSRFIQMVFAVMGLELPRNSAEQGRSGLLISDFDGRFDVREKFAVISGQGVAALTLLRLKGHIMLYLGEEGGRLYAIHATSSYRQKGPQGDVMVPLKRVVVSDLSLGEGSSKGSLLDRVVAVRYLGKGGL